MTKASRFLILFYSSLLFLGGCHEEESAEAFFTSPHYNGDFIANLPLQFPDSVVKRIHDEVPTQWYGLACESAYYHLKEGTPDSVLLRHIDLYEQWFRHDTVFAFTKALRGRVLLRQDRYDTAMICLKQAYNISDKIHSTYRKADALGIMGKLYARQGNYPEAIKQLLDAYNTYALTENPESSGVLFEIMIDIGNAYRGANDYLLAQVWHLQAWGFSRTRDWAKGFKIKSAAAVAENYLHLNRLDSAKVMIDTAFYYQNLYQIFYNVADKHLTLAEILFAQGKCDEALTQFWLAKEKNLKTTDLVRVNKYNKGLGDGYFCEGRLDSAIAYYKGALTTTDTACQASIHQQLSKVYDQQGDYKMAFKENQESQRLSGRIFTIEKNKAIGRLQAENESVRREKQTAEVLNQNKTTRLFMIIGLLILFMIILTGLSLLSQQKQTLQSAKQEKALLAKEKELVEAREQLKTKALVVIKQKLDAKEHELETLIKQGSLKDIMIQQLEMKLAVNVERKEQIDEIELQNLKILTTEDWRKFRQLFEYSYPDFLSKLITQFPKTTGAEMRLLMLIKIGFDANETANALGISSTSVYKSRYRLRKKLGLTEEDDLEAFTQSV